MLKNCKLLYVLPEMAFTASVGEAPGQSTFFVQSFHQINGEFMKDENFLFENLKKLFERVEEDAYTLVLPDFLFTDTIVNVPETDDVKIAQHLRDQLLPRIEVSTFSHETRTSVLLQRKTNAKVQLSAFEKELAATIKLAMGSRQIAIDEVVPLSWTLKAAVSLEPSITIAQLGERLYLAEHYIGINQTINAPLTDLEIVAETVKTLKGADANLQTAYLLTSVLVEEKLKSLLTKTLPVQQLTQPSEEEAKIPSYVKQIIEVSAQTLSLSEFVVPRFNLNLDQQTPAKTKDVSTAAVTVGDLSSSPKSATSNLEVSAPEAITLSVAALPVENQVAEPTDTKQPVAAKASDSSDEAATKVKEALSVSEPEVATTNSATGDGAAVKMSLPEEKPVSAVAAGNAAAALPQTQAAVYLPAEAEPTPTFSDNKKPVAAVSEPEVAPQEVGKAVVASDTEEAAPVLSFLSQQQPQAAAKQAEIDSSPTSLPEERQDEPAAVALHSQDVPDTKDIKDKQQLNFYPKDDKINQNGTVMEQKKGDMSVFLKKFFLFVVIFVVTIVVGIGVGLGILMLTNKNPFQTASTTPTPLPTPVATPEPTVEPTPAPTPDTASSAATPAPKKETVNLAKLKILVVNATKVAGLAGATRDNLQKGDFSGVKTGNAKGTYQTAGNFVLMKDKDTSVIKALEEASKLTLVYDEDYQTEDPRGEYDAVIVLNQK